MAAKSGYSGHWWTVRYQSPGNGEMYLTLEEGWDRRGRRTYRWVWTPKFANASPLQTKEANDICKKLGEKMKFFGGVYKRRLK